MKKGKKKLFAISGIFMVVLLVMAVFAAASDNISAAEEIQQIVEEKQDSSLSADVLGYVENFVEEKGIAPESITNITEVNFGDLPKEISIENVDDTNLAIYQIDYNKAEDQKDKIFVITYSVEKLESQGDLIISQDKREFLTFGFNEETENSGFLKTASGVEGSFEKGYVMMRSGSIIGLSTNLEILSGEGNLEVIIYKNGEQANFGNSFSIDSAGVKKDYDVQSRDIVIFEAGDVISIYVRTSEGIAWKDVTTLLEIITN